MTLTDHRPVTATSPGADAPDEGRTWYRALLFQASRPLTEQTRWGGDLSYTLARSETNTRNGDDPFALDYVSEANFGRIRSLFDERHRIVLNLVTRLPGAIRASTLTTLGSGLPYISNTACDETQARQQQILAGTPDADTRARLNYCQQNGYFGNGNGRETGVYWSGQSGAHALNSRGALYYYWVRNGYINTLGFPTTDEYRGADGKTHLKFTSGAELTWTEAQGVRRVK